jgi:L-2-hydroxyglutarate oxidase LhgO
MSDLNTITSIGAIIEKVGITVASVLGLLVVVKWLSQVHLKALNDRIELLENLNTKREIEITEARKQIIERTDSHSKIVQELVTQVMLELRESRRAAVQTNQVMTRLIDTVLSKPCVAAELHPHDHRPYTRTPSSAELPAPPREVPTDRMGER